MRHPLTCVLVVALPAAINPLARACAILPAPTNPILLILPVTSRQHPLIATDAMLPSQRAIGPDLCNVLRGSGCSIYLHQIRSDDDDDDVVDVLLVLRNYARFGLQ
jgi:hypothetical protein